MARKQKSVAQLWEELTGKEYVVAYVNGEQAQRWNWLDYPLFSFSEVLEITGFPRGRVEGFISRGVLELQAHHPNPGSGRHIRYTGRDVLELMAVNGLTAAGAWPECLKNTFRINGPFDLALNGYRFRDYSDSNRPDTIEMNTRAQRLFYDTGKTDPYSNELELNLARIRREWPRAEWACLTFDVGAFVAETMPMLLRFLESKGIRIEDR
jgi:hypothetical protein